MSKSKTKNPTVKRISQLPIINPQAAGIDVSDTEMMVAYPISAEEIEICSFGCFTNDLRAISERLKKYGIKTIAMESTGVYWVPLFLLLNESGFSVSLVNAKHVKNVTGRKDDESDAEWILKLHRCGLLSSSFQPDNLIRSLRNLVRHRKTLVETSSTYINRMQKSLELMNIKLHTIISDIDGKTGLSIINAILGGERNTAVLAELRDPRIKASKEDIIKSLEGYWTDDHLFTLRQCYQLYLKHREMIEDCDKEIEKQLVEQVASKNEGVIPELDYLPRKINKKHAIKFNVTSYLNKLNGVDITAVTGLSELTVLTIMSEVGTDMTRWKTEHHFTSWLGLVPNTKISGGKIISSRILKKKHYAGQAFRIAANSLYNSKTPLGDFYRRIRAKGGGAKAVVATARKLAIVYYKMVANKEEFKPTALKEFQERYNENKIKQLQKKIEALQKAAAKAAEIQVT